MDFARNRIIVTRMFAVAFFALLLATESALEGHLISSVLFLCGLGLVGVASLGRVWCSMYISGRKDDELVTSGPYSMTRNPLYFFSFLGFTGIGLATETFTFGIAFSVMFLVVYRRVIANEEAFLSQKFGATFADYCARTPRFVPRLALLREPESWTVDTRLFRNTLGDALWFVWLIGLIEFVEALHEYHFLTPLIRVP